jgi:superfamily I DNA/RNA helicase
VTNRTDVDLYVRTLTNAEIPHLLDGGRSFFQRQEIRDLAAILRALVSGAWLRSGARIYLECERAAGVPELPPGWTLLRSKFAGEVGYHLAGNDQENSGLPGNL